jgi:MoaA/NifB/PqqE/SkfB family radical SAM enzyme
MQLLPRSELARYQPPYLLFDVTEKCNFSCRFCLRFDPAKFTGRNKSMDIGLYEDVLRKFPRALAVGLAGLGEPTLHEGIGRMIALARKRNMTTSLITNGSTLRDRAAELIAAGLNRLSVSLKTVRSEEFPSLVGLSSTVYDKVLENVSHTVDLTRRLASPMSIRLSLVVVKSRIGDVPKAIGLARQLGVRFLDLQSLIPSETGDFDSIEALFLEDAETVKSLQAMVREHHGDRSVVVSWPRIISRDGSNLERNCRWYWRALRIDVSGAVNSCGRVYTPKQEYGNAVHVPDVFNGKHFREWRRVFLESDRPLPAACRLCVENFPSCQSVLAG